MIEYSDKLLLQRAIEKLNVANGILSFISDYLRDKYELTTEHTITPDGVIHGPSIRTDNMEESENGKNPIETHLSELSL